MANKLNRKIVLLLALAILTISAFFISYIPYLVADSNHYNEDMFLGQVAYAKDQNMYFSFIRQAYLGKWIFNNRLTHIENRDCFINLQFLGIGKLWKLFNLNENGAYQLWRYLGIVSLIFGYFSLTRFFFKDIKERYWATTLFTFAGGFGIVFLFLNLAGFISYDLFHTLTFDLWAGVFPFQQMLTNPNFSLPHGILLIGVALYLYAYTNNNSSKYYLFSGLVFAVDGIVRPYDLISLFAIIPLFVIVESIIQFDLKRAVKQCIPLFLALPSLLYSIWLFKFDPVFKYWSLQGYNINNVPLPPLHLFSYGIFTIFFLLRLIAIKTNPLSGSERFMVVSCGAIFSMTHIGRIIPSLGFSPQVGIPLFSFVSILSFVYAFACVKKFKKLILSILVFAVLSGFIGIPLYFTQKVTHVHSPVLYLEENDVQAFNWLKSKVTTQDVVLSTPYIASRIAKYTDAQVIAGHYSVTPKYLKQENKLRALFSEKIISKQLVDSLFDKRVSYIYVNKNDTAFIKGQSFVFDGMTKVYGNGIVDIYKNE